MVPLCHPSSGMWFCGPSSDVMEQDRHVLLPQITQHHRLPQGLALPQPGNAGGRQGGLTLVPLSFHWRKSTAASPCSCQGIHHPARDGEAQPQPWAEQGGLCSCAGSEGAGGDLGSGTAAGRGARQGTGPAGPAVHAPLTRGSTFPRHRACGRHPADPQMCAQDGHPG